MLIPWSRVLKYCDNITGIIHVGAYTAEEQKYYGDIPTRWVEADKELFDALKVEDKHWFAATNYTGTAQFNLMPFKAANSLLEPNLNKRRSDVYVEEVVEVPARMIKDIQEKKYNFLNLDIQGAELWALEGCDLDLFEYIYTEVHEVDTYVNCSQLEEIDVILADFDRVATKWTKHKWGDALYVRKR